MLHQVEPIQKCKNDPKSCLKALEFNYEINEVKFCIYVTIWEKYQNFERCILIYITNEVWLNGNIECHLTN